MIRLSNIDGLRVYVNPREISSIEALRHGSRTQAIVHMVNGVRHEVTETADRIVLLRDEALKAEGRDA